MFTFPLLRRPDTRTTTRRPQASRALQVEDLEGRRLLSGIIGNHIGVTADVSVMQVSPAPAYIIGNHIG